MPRTPCVPLESGKWAAFPSFTSVSAAAVKSPSAFPAGKWPAAHIFLPSGETASATGSRGTFQEFSTFPVAASISRIWESNRHATYNLPPRSTGAMGVCPAGKEPFSAPLSRSTTSTTPRGPPSAT